jgi:hypothetical protein
MYTNMKKKYLGNLSRERHVVATWKLGNHLSIIFSIKERGKLADLVIKREKNVKIDLKN